MGNTKKIFIKKSSSTKKTYSIYECMDCFLWQIDPLPKTEDLNKLYQDRYFKQRADKGYFDYNGSEVRNSVQKTLAKNLFDLKFHHLEKKLTHPNINKKCLEIGSASGHCLEYLKERGWLEYGVDISEEMVQKAKQKKLNIFCIDFLNNNLESILQENKFQAIFLWATIEHLPNFMDYLKKIYSLLHQEGEFYLSTCHTGYWAKKNGHSWRYLNVPEHIFYFSKKSLELAFQKVGFKVKVVKTYGSGFTSHKNMNLFYKIQKKIFDFTAKYFSLGDMIIYSLSK